MSDQTRQYIFNKEFLVTSADVDFEGKVHVSAFVNFLIQSAWQHAEHLGWGVDEMNEHNLAWILSSLQLKIIDYPKWRQTIRCETWPKGVDRLFYLRDFKIFDSDNNLLATGTSNWILIDIERRRPKLHKLDDEAIRKNANLHAIEEKIASIKFDGEMDSTYDYMVRYSDIDINKHLTTTRYIDLMFDTYRPMQISKNRPSEITLNFIKEVTFDEHITMVKGNLVNNTTKFQLISEKHEKPCFKAELKF
jgi:medium-chain acyl-[acyl-carrier-protein] hydrolase